MASFAVGDAVDCLAAAGAAWAPYRVARVRPDRRVDLFSADGARLHRVDPRRLRRRGTAAATTTDTPRAMLLSTTMSAAVPPCNGMWCGM